MSPFFIIFLLQIILHLLCLPFPAWAYCHKIDFVRQLNSSFIELISIAIKLTSI